MEINSVDDLWNWLINDFSPKIRANPWYNKMTDSDLIGYIGDFTSKMIGYGILKQVRVRNNSCTVISNFNNTIDQCYSDSLYQTDTSDYSVNWTSFNSSFIPIIDKLNAYKSFQHMSASSLDDYSYMTDLNTYLGDGYVFNLTGSLNQLQSNLTLLKSLNWIDRQTRAIFIQFLVFNPNINMFAYVNILFEILPSGNMINSIQIDTINLYKDLNQTNILFKIYIVLICFMLIIELTIMQRMKWQYLIQFWSWVNLLIISFSIASFAISFSFLSNKQASLDLICKTKELLSYINFQGLIISNKILIYLLASTCFFSTIKFIRLFRFIKKVQFFSRVYKKCLINMTNFSIIFLVFVFAFTQLMFLSFNDQTKDFRSFSASIVSVFKLLIRKLTIPYLNNNSIIFPFFVIIDFILVSLFIIILQETLKLIKKKEKKSKDKYEIDFIKMFKFKLANIFKRKRKLKRNVRFKDNLNEFTISTSRLLAYFTEVLFFFYTSFFFFK